MLSTPLQQQQQQEQQQQQSLPPTTLTPVRPRQRPHSAFGSAGHAHAQLLARSPGSPSASPSAAGSPLEYTPGGSGAGRAGRSGAAVRAAASASPWTQTPSGPLRHAASAAPQSLGELLLRRAELVLSDQDRDRFKTNAKALAVVLLLAGLAAMSGYPVNPLRWHPTLAGGSLLLVLVVLVLNILTIAFKFVRPWRRGVPAATPSPATPASPFAAQIESRGEAWSPVRASSPYRQAAMRTPSEDTLRNRAATTASPGMTATMSPLGRASAAKPFILRGSPMRKDLPMINDRAGLSRFLDDSERRLDQISASSATGRDSLSASLATAASAAPTITRFQPAVKPAANLVAKEVIEDGLVVRDPAKTLREWKAEPFIDEWAESTRKWLATFLLQPLVARIEQTDRELVAAGFAHLTCATATASGELLHIRSPLEQQNAANAAAAAAAAKKPAGFGLFGGPGQTSMFPAAAPAQPQPPAIPQTLQQLADGHASNATARSRVALERYLAVGKYTCREYILDRIKNLAQGSCLATYQWNGGQPWDGKPWKHDSYPSDAELVMHLFCRYLDELTNTLEPHKISGFSDKHFLPVGAKPVAVAAVMIREQSRWPAHYQLVVDNTIWDVYPSRNNLFHVLSLFVYAIKCLSSGFIGLLSLGGRSTRLLDIVATGPLISRFETPRKRHGQPTTGAAPAGGAAGSDSAQPIPSVVFTPVTARR